MPKSPRQSERKRFSRIGAKMSWAYVKITMYTIRISQHKAADCQPRGSTPSLYHGIIVESSTRAEADSEKSMYQNCHSPQPCQGPHLPVNTFSSPGIPPRIPRKEAACEIRPSRSSFINQLIHALCGAYPTGTAYTHAHNLPRESSQTVRPQRGFR